MSSSTAWLGCLLVAASVYIEKYVYFMIGEIKRFRSSEVVPTYTFVQTTYDKLDTPKIGEREMANLDTAKMRKLEMSNLSEMEMVQGSSQDIT